MMKQLLSTVICSASMLAAASSYATFPPLYLDGQLGYAKLYAKGVLAEREDIRRSTGLVGRLAVGYQINDCAAVELGYFSALWSNNTRKARAFDLAAKAVLIRISNGFSLYTKLGVAYVDMLHGSGNGVLDKEWAPEASVGLSYALAPNLPIQLSWTHIHPLSKLSDRRSVVYGNFNFFAVGAGYSFG